MIAATPIFVSSFILLIILGALMSVLFIVVKILTGIFGATRGLFRLAAKPFRAKTIPLGHKQCSRWNCQCLNPTDANYCRRCGNGF